MSHHYLSQDEMLCSVGKLGNGAIQPFVGKALHARQKVISRLWSPYRSIEDVVSDPTV